jgi:hypothetical protein
MANDRALVPSRRWIVAKWRQLFGERPDDPLPMEAIAVAVAGSVAAMAIALAIDGATFRGYDFLVNVLASLALLGPGLIVTNVVVRNWRHKRVVLEASPEIAKLLDVMFRFANGMATVHANFVSPERNDVLLGTQWVKNDLNSAISWFEAAQINILEPIVASQDGGADAPLDEETIVGLTMGIEWRLLLDDAESMKVLMVRLERLADLTEAHYHHSLLMADFDLFMDYWELNPEGQPTGRLPVGHLPYGRIFVPTFDFRFIMRGMGQHCLDMLRAVRQALPE